MYFRHMECLEDDRKVYVCFCHHPVKGSDPVIDVGK